MNTRPRTGQLGLLSWDVEDDEVSSPIVEPEQSPITEQVQEQDVTIDENMNMVTAGPSRLEIDLQVEDFGENLDAGSSEPEGFGEDLHVQDDLIMDSYSDKSNSVDTDMGGSSDIESNGNFMQLEIDDDDNNEDLYIVGLSPM